MACYVASPISGKFGKVPCQSKIESWPTGWSNLTLGEIRTKFFPSISLVKKPIRWKTEWVDISHGLFQRHSTAAFFPRPDEWNNSGVENHGADSVAHGWAIESRTQSRYWHTNLGWWNFFPKKKNKGLYPLVNIAGWNIPVFNRKYIFNGSIFHFYV